MNVILDVICKLTKILILFKKSKNTSVFSLYREYNCLCVLKIFVEKRREMIKIMVGDLVSLSNETSEGSACLETHSESHFSCLLGH